MTINMSEFQERHTVSRLIGSPPGYVGYGEGGKLTEAVRQRPYSVVLLDECEKADLEVMNLFYQVFDKGTLNDGEGRTISFSNTLVVMTSNLATDPTYLRGRSRPRRSPRNEDLVALVKPTLSEYFKPALLARMTVVPFVPIRPEALDGIVRMKIGAVAARALESHKVTLSFEDSVISADRRALPRGGERAHATWITFSVARSFRGSSRSASSARSPKGAPPACAEVERGDGR